MAADASELNFAIACSLAHCQPDLELLVGPDAVRVMAVAATLCSVSPFFKTMLSPTSGMAEAGQNSIQLPGSKPKVVLNIVKVLSCPIFPKVLYELRMQPDEILDVITQADEWQCSCIVKEMLICLKDLYNAQLAFTTKLDLADAESGIIGDASPEEQRWQWYRYRLSIEFDCTNLLALAGYIKVALLHTDGELKQQWSKVKSWALQKLVCAIGSDWTFLEDASFELLSEVLSSDMLDIGADEGRVLSFVVKWLEFDPVRQKYLSECLKLVKFPLIDFGVELSADVAKALRYASEKAPRLTEQLIDEAVQSQIPFEKAPTQQLSEEAVQIRVSRKRRACVVLDSGDEEDGDETMRAHRRRKRTPTDKIPRITVERLRACVVADIFRSLEEKNVG